MPAATLRRPRRKVPGGEGIGREGIGREGIGRDGFGGEGSDRTEQAMHPNVQLVAQALAAAGAGGQVRELADAVRTAQDAAAALGCSPAAIANSLIFMADEQPVLILTSGGHKVDTAHVAGLLGVDRLRRATPDQVRAATGQPIGGVAPVGHPAPVRTLVDVALQPFPVIWAAGGTPHTVFPTTYAELLTITGGTPVAVVAD
ncbi:YbaK/prolyl-tRNA synthetase associated region [Nakamurella multipartita DSM 44233]|uniref:YbaK/prolyl-tRNA synthetase associated region n=2 Tax=Nakamurella TaxID=53460 RepID=C8XEX4_NAKMY|nr:YbaK/prolyl-tRNA synthetase associated region [Nakamurella multipartita DSM 44233]